MIFLKAKLNVWDDRFFLNYEENAFRKCFLQIFENRSSRLIGRYEEANFGGFLGLRIRIIVECFHIMGKYDNLRIELENKFRIHHWLMWVRNTYLICLSLKLNH